jgi:hypothetical protein
MNRLYEIFGPVGLLAKRAESQNSFYTFVIGWMKHVVSSKSPCNMAQFLFPPKKSVCGAQ